MGRGSQVAALTFCAVSVPFAVAFEAPPSSILDAAIALAVTPNPVPISDASYPIRVQATLLIDKFGNPQDVHVALGQAPAAMNKETLQALDRWRFWPARTSCGGVAQKASVTFRFERDSTHVDGFVLEQVEVPLLLREVKVADLTPADLKDPRRWPKGDPRPGFVDLVPIEREPPKFPQRALQAGAGGYAFVLFEVDPEGKTAHAAVTDSWARDAAIARHFGAAAVRAVARWRFKPATQDGAPVARWACQRFNFELQY